MPTSSAHMRGTRGMRETDALRDEAPASGREHTQLAQLSRRLGMALLLVMLGVALGAIVGQVLAPQPPDTSSAEVGFAQRMTVHHAQAVAMATIIRDRSTDPELQSLALDIMLTQQAQIGQMQGWLTLWRQPLSPPVNTTAIADLPGQGTMATMPGMDSTASASMSDDMPGMATQGEINALRTMPVPEAGASFLRLMIRHHQGGVTMAREVLRQTSRPEVSRLARSIVESQQSEITYMQQLLARRGLTAG